MYIINAICIRYVRYINDARNVLSNTNEQHHILPQDLEVYLKPIYGSKVNLLKIQLDTDYPIAGCCRR
jgi:hypothetical protein